MSAANNLSRKHVHIEESKAEENGYKISLKTLVLRGEVEEASKEHAYLLIRLKALLGRNDNYAPAMADCKIETVIHYRQIIVREEGEFDFIPVVGNQDEGWDRGPFLEEAGTLSEQEGSGEVQESTDRSGQENQDAPLE